MEEILYNPIGVVHSSFKKPKGVPIQSVASDARGTIEIFPEFVDGLADIGGFSEIVVLFHFHLSGTDFSLKVIPYLDDKKRGVFATRAPRRPNNIGLSVVRLKKVEENILYIKGVDMLEGTPVLDIKPFVPGFETNEKTETGWLKNRVEGVRQARDDGRFQG